MVLEATMSKSQAKAEQLTEDRLNWLKSRRSIRRYKTKPVPHEMIERLLEAATWAPSAHNRQPWRFAVISGPDRKHELAQAMGRRLRSDLTADKLSRHQIDADVGRSYQRLTSAPVLILLCLSMEDMDVYPDETRQHKEWVMAVQSTAMAGQNLLLAAHAQGLAACWMCAPLFSPGVAANLLALPTDWQPQAIVTVGWAAETREKERHPLHSRTIIFQ
jgi:F420 biosynthesis protein FbiB-like protein